jgi:hypothetical protein
MISAFGAGGLNMNWLSFLGIAVLLVLGFYNTERGLDRVEKSLLKRIDDLEAELERARNQSRN